MEIGKAKFGRAQLPLLCAVALVLSLSTPVSAEDAETTDAPVTTSGGQSFSIEDEADSPPVSFRSEIDERYDTTEQHDAEMFAEEYEKQRDEKRAKDKALLDNMNTVSSPNNNSLNGDLGANDVGFPPRAPY